MLSGSVALKGEPAGVTVSTSDVLTKLLASDGLGVAYLDRDLRLRRWNSTWAERLGILAARMEGLSGEPLGEIIPAIELRIRRALAQPPPVAPVVVHDVPCQGREGTSHQDLVLIPLAGAEGMEGFLHLVIDAGERASTREALQRSVVSYRRELTALRDIMSVAAEPLELKNVLRRLLDHVLRMMKSKVGAIHLFDEQRTVLELAASRGVPKWVLKDLETVAGPFDPAVWLAGGGEAYVVPEIADPLRLSVAAAGGHRATAYVGVPVRSGGERLGLISVVGRPGREFDDEDVALLTSIADQVGVVVENARLHRHAEQLAVVRERERLARELHDSVTQSLYSLTLLAEASQRLLSSGDSERAAEYTERLGEIAQQALKEMRLLVYQLRPLVLKREGLVGALQQRLDAVEKRAGVDARLLVDGPLDLPAHVEEGLYRIAQEALNNALKHAAPRSVLLCIEADSRHVNLSVGDDGRGFDPEAVSDRGGMGLISMRERAERLGGSFSLVSAAGEGTEVRVDVEVPT